MAADMKADKKLYDAIGDCAARINFSWSWGRDALAEQDVAKQICRAIGIPVKRCKLPCDLQGSSLTWKPSK